MIDTNLILSKYKTLFEDFLDQEIQKLPCCELSEAIVYSVKNGGKRLRPTLMLLTADALGVDLNKVLPFALSLELIHCSSLVHDDLPALDNDNLRRGKPSCHVKFGEAEAILCGDAMLNYAYEIASFYCQDKNDIISLNTLAKYSGIFGMLGGQYLDVTCEKRNIKSKEILLDIQKNKTSALFTLCFIIPSILANNNYYNNLENYGQNLGIAFQIVDDILDEISNQETLGKSIGKDKSSGKLTSVALYGLEKSKEMSEVYTKNAIDSLKDNKIFNNLVIIANELLTRIKWD